MYLLVLLYWCELQCLVWFLSVSHKVVVVTTGVMRMICTRPWLDTHLLQVLPGAEGVHKLLSGGWQCVHCELSGQYCPGLRPLCQQITNTQWSVLWTEVLYPMLSDDKTHTMVSSVNRGAVPYALWWQNTHSGQFWLVQYPRTVWYRVHCQ